MTMLAALGSLVRYEFGRALSPGRWIPTVLLCFLVLLPLAIRMPNESGIREHRIFLWATTSFFLGLVPMICALLHAIPTSSAELKEATSTFIFTGVVPRPLVFLTKALVLALFVSLHLSVGVLSAFLIFSPEPSADTWGNALTLMGLTSVDALVWVVFYMCCGYLFKKPLAAALGVSLIMEFIVGRLPFDMAPYTIRQTLRGIVTETMWVDGKHPGRWFNQWQGRIDFLETGDAVLYLCILLTALFALGMAVLWRRSLTGGDSGE